MSDANEKYNEVLGEDMPEEQHSFNIMEMVQHMINKDDYEIIQTNVRIMAPDFSSLTSTTIIRPERDLYEDESRKQTLDHKQLPTLTQVNLNIPPKPWFLKPGARVDTKQISTLPS